ncbi:hypothetical protein MTP03_32470 [Tsukamurella sp. PLM1]|nr:hypothetical protein MTP03_32470 [Tsukamurella sp. PLM1]
MRSGSRSERRRGGGRLPVPQISEVGVELALHPPLGVGRGLAVPEQDQAADRRGEALDGRVETVLDVHQAPSTPSAASSPCCPSPSTSMCGQSFQSFSSA